MKNDENKTAKIYKIKIYDDKTLYGYFNKQFKFVKDVFNDEKYKIKAVKNVEKTSNAVFMLIY